MYHISHWSITILFNFLPNIFFKVLNHLSNKHFIYVPFVLVRIMSQFWRYQMNNQKPLFEGETMQ
jgi:hypothetical protein